MISRRVLLSWLGASAGACAVTAGSPLSAVAGARSAPGTRIVNLESFCVAHGGHESRLHAYLADTLLPRMQELHQGPRLCLDAIVAPHTPQAIVLAMFSSFDEMLEIRASLASSPRIRQARAELESARILEEVRSQVLVVSEESLPWRSSADLKSFQSGVFEVRSYDAPAWHDGVPTRVIALLRRAGIHPIVDAATAAGEHMPRFTYVVPFASLAAREQAWTSLEADAEWMDMQRESAATVTGKSIYKLAPYSQLG
jgi:hypothetical protein